ncbi:MAG: hypothetical protein DI568_16690 [Sphingomonas sp.]|nr:MAG: hypothetical protein DI568_16690 [Sphingomonas sp.]
MTDNPTTPAWLTRDTPIRDLPLSTRVRRALVAHLMECHGLGWDAPLSALELLDARELRERVINFGAVSHAELAAFLRGPGAGLVQVEGLDG